MSKNIITHPTIGGAAKILGVSKRRLEKLFREGMTPAVKRDERGVRRYPALALQQARKHLFLGTSSPLKQNRNIVLLSYVVGAGIAWLVRPQLSAFLGIPITLLLINQFIKILDIQISDKSNRLKKNSVIGAISILSLLLGVGTIYVAPTVSGYIQVMINCARYGTRTENLCANFKAGSDTQMDSESLQKPTFSNLPTETMAAPTTGTTTATETPLSTVPVQETVKPTTIFHEGPPSTNPPQPSSPGQSNSGENVPPTSSPPLTLSESPSTPASTQPPPTPPVQNSTYHKFDGQGNCIEADFPETANPNGWLAGTCQ
jgi:hypothetical protein